jgi:outer membrane protein assembly factor BamA
MSFCISSISKRSALFFFLFSFVSIFSQNPDSSAIYHVEKLSIKGNRKTKEAVILRELPKDLADSMPLKLLPYFIQRSQHNIFNTQLFIYDTLYCKTDHNKKSIEIEIVVKERWYIWPVPVFEIQDRNFNSWWQTKDLFRINYGLALGWDNFTGRKDPLVILFQRGYSEKYGFSYRFPYLNKKQTLGFNLLYAFGRNNEVNYDTQNNEPLFVRDYKQYLRKEHEAKAGIIHRPNLYEQNTFEVVYHSAKIGDTVVKLNPFFFGGGANNLQYVSLQYRYTFDNRDNRVYPLEGWAFDGWIYKDGLDLSPSSPVNLFHATASIRKHSPLQGRFYLANLVRGRLMNTDKLTYNFNRAFGYSEYARGYEYYVIDGQRYFLTTNSLRYQIIKPHITQPLLLSRFKQFSTVPYYAFINLFFDAAYAEDKFFQKNNPLANTWQYAYGVGFDFVSYYDVVLRLEYAVNRQFRHGFYIHFTSGF